MSKKNQNKKVSKNQKTIKKDEVPVIKNPINSLGGKIVVWVMIFGFVGVMIAAIIIALVA